MSAVINDFLRGCARKVRARAGRVTVVMGNEGGDMDSVVGAVYLAYYLHTTDKHPALRDAVPVLNFPADDLPLRNDVRRVLAKHGVDASLLLSAQRPMEEGDAEARYVDLHDTNCQLVLYDHNVLRAEQRQLASRVVGIVDHHADERQYLTGKPLRDVLRIVRTVGSACTIVAELYHADRLHVPLPQLLMAPIVLDTVNFDPAQKKVTEADVAMYRWLQTQCEARVEATAMFKELYAWKGEVLGLTFAQNLRRDYKQFAFDSAVLGRQLTVGISSMPCRYGQLERHYTHAAMLDACDAMLTRHSLDALLLMLAGHSESGKDTRELAIFAAQPVLELLREYAASSPGGIAFALQASSRATRKDYTLECYAIADASVSRKRLSPSLASYLKSSNTSSL